MLASILESGAVYYPLTLGLPIVVGSVLGRRSRSRQALWILAAVVLAFVLFDFAFDETRFEDARSSSCSRSSCSALVRSLAWHLDRI